MLGISDVFNYFLPSRGVPQPRPHNIPTPGRSNRFGEPIVVTLTSRDDQLADEGSLFVVGTPTPGTGIATIAVQASLADTAPLIMGQNRGSKTMYPRWVKLTNTAAGTAGASVKWAVKIDPTNNPARYTSGNAMGVAVATDPVVGRPCMTSLVGQDGGAVPAASGMVWFGGALVAAAASAQSRLLGSGQLRVTIPVIGDRYLVNFGAPDPQCSLSVPATIAQIQDHHLGVGVLPGEWFLFHLWLPSQSAASSWEIEIGYVER